MLQEEKHNIFIMKLYAWACITIQNILGLWR